MVCGIDFGTSNTLSAVSLEGRDELVALENSSDSTPSAVFFPFSNIENPIYGNEASSLYTQNAYGRYMKSFKRILGTSFFDSGTNLRPGLKIKFHKLIVDYLTYIKNTTENSKQKEISHVVMGKPVRLSEDGSIDGLSQFKLILSDVGFKSYSFLDEPIAAAYHHHKNIKNNSYSLIADLGGGTCDFSLVHKAAKGNLNILSTSGVSVGGTDIDSNFALTSFFDPIGYRSIDKFKGLNLPDKLFHYAADWNKITTSLYTPKSELSIKKMLGKAKEKEKIERFYEIIKDKKAHTVLQFVEDCKIELSTHKEKIVVNELLSNDPFCIRQQEMNDGIKSIVDSIMKTAIACVKLGGVSNAKVDQLILAGGTSKLPIVKDGLLSTFNNASVINKDTMDAVVRGLLEKAKENI